MAQPKQTQPKETRQAKDIRFLESRGWELSSTSPRHWVHDYRGVTVSQTKALKIERFDS